MVEIIATEKLSEGQQLIRARGPLAEWTMERAGDDEPIFPSNPLAKALGFTRARTLNELIVRIYPKEVEYRGTMPRYSPAEGEVIFRRGQSGKRGQPIKDYLLTRRQALKIIMRSDTPQADALQDEMVDILLMVMRGPDARVIVEQVVRAVLEVIQPILDGLEQRIADLEKVCAEAGEQDIRRDRPQRHRIASSRRHLPLALRPLPPGINEEILRLLGKEEFKIGLIASGVREYVLHNVIVVKRALHGMEERGEIGTRVGSHNRIVFFHLMHASEQPPGCTGATP